MDRVSEDGVFGFLCISTQCVSLPAFLDDYDDDDDYDVNDDDDDYDDDLCDSI